MITVLVHFSSVTRYYFMKYALKKSLFKVKSLIPSRSCHALNPEVTAGVSFYKTCDFV